MVHVHEDGCFMQVLCVGFGSMYLGTLVLWYFCDHGTADFAGQHVLHDIHTCMYVVLALARVAHTHV